MRDQIIALFQQVLRDLREEVGDDKGGLGIPPTVLYVSQTEPSDHRNFNTGTVLRRWKVEESRGTEMRKEQLPPDQVKNGMYYDSGRADFSFLPDPPRVRVGWQVGPRYGRGYDYPIVDGNLSEEAKPLWLS